MTGISYAKPGNLAQPDAIPQVADTCFTYDAAGRLANVGVQDLSLYYDGDDRDVARKQATTVTYYVRSSVLGGAIISEVSSGGQKLRGYIYANGEMVAKQENGQTVWLHGDAAGITEVETSNNGTVGSRVQKDPLGVMTANGMSGGTVNPISFYGTPSLPGDGCWIDNVPSPCTLATAALNSGAGVPCPPGGCGPRPIRDANGNATGGFEVFHAFADGRSGWLPTDAIYAGGPNGRWHYRNSDAGGFLGITRRVASQRSRPTWPPPATTSTADGQLSPCLRDALRPFFPQNQARGKLYSPVDDARFKAGIPAFYNTGQPAITLGLYDIYYDPQQVRLDYGNFEDLQTIVEEVAHTVQFIALWDRLKPNPLTLQLTGRDSTDYNGAKAAWENEYVYFSAKGLLKNGDAYENDVEKWAKNKTFDVLFKLQDDKIKDKQYNLCGFSILGQLGRPGY